MRHRGPVAAGAPVTTTALVRAAIRARRVNGAVYVSLGDVLTLLDREAKALADLGNRERAEQTASLADSLRKVAA